MNTNKGKLNDTIKVANLRPRTRHNLIPTLRAWYVNESRYYLMNTYNMCSPSKPNYKELRRLSITHGFVSL